MTSNTIREIAVSEDHISTDSASSLPSGKASCLNRLGKRWAELSKGKKAGIIIGALALIALIATAVGMHFNGGIPHNWDNLTASAQHSMKNLGKWLSGLNGDAAVEVFGGGAVLVVALFGLGYFAGKLVSKKQVRVPVPYFSYEEEEKLRLEENKNMSTQENDE